MKRYKKKNQRTTKRYEIVVNPSSELDWNQSTDRFTKEPIDSRDHLVALESPKK